MRTIFLPMLAVTLLSACRTAPTSSLDEERAVIRAVIEDRERQFAQALARKDAELLARDYAWDAFVLRADSPSLRKDDLLAFFQAYLATNPKLDTTTEYVDISQSLDMAYEVGAMVEEYDEPAARLRARSKYLAVWKKVGGTWRLGAEAVLYDTRTDTLYLLDSQARADTLRERQRVADSVASNRVRPRPDGVRDGSGQ